MRVRATLVLISCALLALGLPVTGGQDAVADPGTAAGGPTLRPTASGAAAAAAAAQPEAAAKRDANRNKMMRAWKRFMRRSKKAGANVKPGGRGCPIGVERGTGDVQKTEQAFYVSGRCFGRAAAAH
jgi:hypothetical protein